MRGAEHIDNEKARALFQSLTYCAKLVLSDLVEESDQRDNEFRFNITRGEYEYRAQLVCHDALNFATLYLFPDVLCEPDEAAVAYELAARLNDHIVVGSYAVNPSKNSGIYFRSWRWLDKKEEEIRSVRNLLNSCDYSLKCFEQAYRYWSNWGLSVEDAVMTAGL